MLKKTQVTRRLVIFTLVFIILVYISYRMIQASRISVTSRFHISSQDILDKNGVTVVTGYFPLPRAKHSAKNYMGWLENLLSFCSSPMIIFTSVEFYPQLYRLRRNGSLPTYFIVNYSSPLEMPPIRPLVSTFEKQHSTDPERAYHSVELYAVWCAKSFMLNRSTELNPFRTQFFLYADAGAFRTVQYRFQTWPDSSLLRLILSNDRFLLGMIAPLPRRFCQTKYQLSDGPFRMDLIEGTFMAGSLNSIHWWADVFYQTIDEYRMKNFFIGKDQSVMNAIALAHADRLNMLLPFRTSCGNVWFAFGPLFADKREREKLSFSYHCQQQNVSTIVIPFESICAFHQNVV